MTEHEAAAAWWILADPTITASVPSEPPPLPLKTGPGVTGSERREPALPAAGWLPGHLPSGQAER